MYLPLEFEMTEDSLCVFRLSTLRDGRSAVAHYTVGMIDLLASCAEVGLFDFVSESREHF